MRWIGVAMALGLGLAAVHVEPLAGSLALMGAALVCLACSAPRSGRGDPSRPFPVPGLGPPPDLHQEKAESD